MLKIYISVAFFITLLKFLFYPSYVSTDFEVHRNWLAITNDLPINQWYFDNTSKWTLDYPPLFAWFEYSLSIMAKQIDSNMTKLGNLNYISPRTRFFQKSSVIISDSVFIYAIFKIIRCKPTSKRLTDSLFVLLLSLRTLAPFGLLLIDHIHFQYNGFLFGILLLSILNVMNRRFYWTSFWFSVLLNFKHIFIYYAPAYAVYMLYHFCFVTKAIEEKEITVFDRKRFCTMALIVLGVFTVSFGPFLAINQLGQVLGRLFPFDKRGLTHSYWAPNAWAIYNFCDVIANRLLATLGAITSPGSMTKGLVEIFEHSVLMNIRPLHTVILTLLSIIPALLKCRSSNSFCDFLKLLSICGWSAFMFGWHVHEKAVLMITIPLMIIELLDVKCIGISFYISTIGHFSLLPLIPTISEYWLKTVLYLACTCTHYVIITYMHDDAWKSIPRILRIHIFSLVPLWILTDFILPFAYPNLEFLPLMLISVSTAAGLLVAYVHFYMYYLTGNDKWCYFVTNEKVTTSKKCN